MAAGLALLLCAQLAGEVCARLIDLPVPGPVLGMLFLFVLLIARERVAGTVREPSLGLLRHLSLLFVPAGVGLIRHLGRIRAELAAIAVAIVISTALTIAVTAAVFQAVARALDREEG